jgi:2-amino-4-hydroxy-6-hydroxymethyldihydropteridine diphosphokinase
VQRVYVSVGSNLGDRAFNCEKAIYEISVLADVTATSSFYETEPVGNEEQPLFINCAVEIMTDIPPHELLAELLDIENKLGRVRWGQGRASHGDAGAGIKSEDRDWGRRVNVVCEREQDKIRTAMPGDKEWGPRVIDLDIIYYGSEIIDDPDLKIPHPEAHVRRFVLEPLAEIAPDYLDPVFKVTVVELLDEIKDTHGVNKIERPSTPDPQ